MYSAAVGLPGLIPIQYIFDRIVPLTLTAPFKASLEDALANAAKENPEIKRLSLTGFTMGDSAPQITEARLFDLGPKDMAFDLDIVWRSTIRADLDVRLKRLGGTKVPASIRNVKFEGPVRLIVVGLMTEEPGYEALLVSLPRPPKIGFDLRVAGGALTEIPFLRKEMARILDKAVEEEILWPRRAVVPAPSPFKTKSSLNPAQILLLMRDDPLLRRERELMASVPDDFRSGLSEENLSSSQQGEGDDATPVINIRDVNGSGGKNGYDDDSDGDGGGSQHPRWMFWRREAKEDATALELFSQSLLEEKRVPVMIVKERVARERSLVERALSNLILPRSIVSYVGREAG